MITSCIAPQRAPVSNKVKTKANAVLIVVDRRQNIMIYNVVSRAEINEYNNAHICTMIPNKSDIISIDNNQMK